MLHIGLIWANPYSRNLGVGALAYSSLALLSDVCKENGIEADFTIIGSSGTKTDTIDINGKRIAVRNIVGNDHLKWKSLLRLALMPRRYRTSSILNLDVVFDISEGDSFTDIYGEKRYEKIMNSKRFFNLLKTRQVLLPQTIGPFNSPVNEKRAFNVMRKTSMVISRDKQSLDYTARFLPNDQIMETIDVAFYLDYVREKFDPTFNHVGINISALLWNGGYTRKNQFNLKTDYRRFVNDAVEYFCAMPGVKVHFISHVISKRASVEDDYTVAEEFHKKHADTILAPKFKTPVEAKNYISGLNFFFGSRMHACIAAFSSGVPVFPVAYSRKFNGLFGETLNYLWIGDCITQTNDIVLTNLKEAFSKQAVLRATIRTINEDLVQTRILALKDQLLKLVIDDKVIYAEN